MKLKLIALLSCCLTITLVFFYACTDKELETNSLEEATTRAVQEQISSKYYHILPGSDEWRALQTGQDMWDACQLPEDLLEELSTEELVEACMDFPMAYDYSAFDNEREAISHMINRFNGLTALSKREDAVSYMTNAYNAIYYTGKPLELYDNNKSVALSLGYIELLLVDEAFLGRMTESDLLILKNVAEEKYMHKLEYSDYFGLLSLKHSLMVCAELALATITSYSEEEIYLLTGFAHFYSYFTPEELESISELIFRKE